MSTTPSFRVRNQLIAAPPLYAQITEIIRSRITSGQRKAGDQLPSEPQLCSEFGVSSITLRRALRDLSDEGLLTRRQGLGTFVSDQHHLVFGFPRLSSLTEDLERRGWISTSRVLRQETIAAPVAIADGLALEPDELVTVLTRLRLADNEPIALQTAWLPARLFPGLDKTSQLHAVSLYSLLAEQYAVRPNRAIETFAASLADASEGRELNIATGDPVFRVQRITTDERGRDIELVESVIRGDRYSLSHKLHVSAH